ncbi:N-methyl-L-tryptophan oxidase [Ammoniphilus sp. YIM 78166]|uniref:N-methyl-L-tryptophan oxidase n=1 Tax=Ammoniphilus sp. YIM 78166 TaxID=1644106 RepID=UPI001F100D32|nr:N-methyl-L-tryptophan oxidase [Ammoniphilus sp. YIM 78166]
MNIMNTTHCDVLILGAGSMGMAAGNYLARKGIRTILLDAYDPPHIHGSHHGDTRLFRYAYSEHDPYVPLALRALELWKELEEESGMSIFEQTGVLSIGIDGPDSLEDKLEAARIYSLPVERFSREELIRRWTGLVLPDGAEGLLETKAGILSPEKAIRAYRQLAVEAGAILYTNTVAEKIIYHQDGVTVQTKNGKFTAGKLLVCSGAGNATLFPEWQLPLRVVRKTVGWFETRGDQFRSPAFPGFVITKGSIDYYGFPDFEGGGLKIGRHDGGQEVKWGEEIAPFGSYAQDEHELRDALDCYMPQASGQLLRGSTCLYTVTPDEDFIIDHHPSFPHVLIAAGFSGHGFKFVSSLGEVLGQLLINGKSDINLHRFKLNRFK